MILYGLIGKKLIHSYSAELFNTRFKNSGIDAHYDLFEFPSLDNFKDWIKCNPDIRGLNVTIPYKREIIKYMDRISPVVEATGSLNVIKVNTDGTLYGFNSDYYGFRDSLRPLIKEPFLKELERCKKTADCNTHDALVLGSGGVSGIVNFALRNLSFSPLLVSRNPRPDMIGYDDLSPQLMKDIKIIVNTTPCGMFPDVNTSPSIPYQYIEPATICYDLVYNPEVTEFMRRCKEKGAVVKNGMEMLMLQAQEAWRIWNEKNDTLIL